MFRFMRNLLTIAAVFTLCVGILEPVLLLPCTLYAVGLGIGALLMHLADGFDNSRPPEVVITAPTPTQTIYVASQPTYARSWGLNPFNWFSGRQTHNHHVHNTHGHQHTVITHPSQTERVVHTPSHHRPIFSSSSAPHVSVSSHQSFNQNGHSHGHR